MSSRAARAREPADVGCATQANQSDSPASVRSFVPLRMTRIFHLLFSRPRCDTVVRRWLFHLRSIIRQQFKHRQSAIEFLHQGPNAFAAKSVYERAVVPEGTLLAGVESRPELFALLAI